ncbi:signal recognition particle protein [Holzapfeliella sp. He02]|uniref:Signal recognition particle protein n=1 Tax=Holzapfeliella saturejae TaxID=3082953 RepID=A0ABU8SHP1_9LACO
MAFEGLSERIQNALSGLRKKGKVTQTDINQATREIRLALLEADVNFKVVKEFIAKIKERALGSDVLESLTPGQQIIKIVNEELTQMMGESAVELTKSDKIPTVIMMVGLQGTGKTTTAGKLANRLMAEQKARPLLIAADIYRPAAVDQLKVIGNQLEIPVYEEGVDNSAEDIVRHGMQQAKENKNDYVIIDTAGRLEIDETLMDELKNVKEIAQPDNIVLVADAMTGQAAATVADGFNQALDITGVILTKLDGDTRGGAALSIRSITNKPILYVGEGEKLSDLDIFHPDRMANRILGMGDMMSLIEKAQKDYDQKNAQELAEKMRENTFDFNDFIDQMDQIQSMGPIDELIKMIPGMANNPALQNINIGEKDIAHLKAIVYSMTPEERENPDILTPSRRRRIAAGSGRNIQEIHRMIKQFKQSKEMMQKVSKGNTSDLEGMLGGGMKGKMGKMAMNSMMKRSQKKKKKRLKKAKRFKS